MSTEHENSLVAMPQPETVVISCSICHEPLVDNDSQLSCTCENCAKSVCAECLERLIRVVFNQPTLSYPFRCLSCACLLDQRVLEDMITKRDDYEKFIACVLPLFWSKACLEDNEQLASCPFCPYLEIHTTDACPLQLLTCQNSMCGIKSCLVCRHAVDDENLSIHQGRCRELHLCKQMIDEAIESGSTQHCPYCQLTGLKDDGCTHMVCQRCHRPWCYICGMKENECKVADGVEPSLSAHNTDWESNEGRCPMSLLCIRELDDRWPETDRACLEYFHRYRTLNYLHDVFERLGEEKFNEINHYFGTVDASGYTIEEIKNHQDQKLILYPVE